MHTLSARDLLRLTLDSEAPSLPTKQRLAPEEPPQGPSPLEVPSASSASTLLAAQSELPAGVGLTFTYVTGQEELNRQVEYLASVPEMGVDLETTGLDPHADQIRLVTMATTVPQATASTPATHAVVVDAFACPGWRDLVRPVLENAAVTKLFHNAKFDLSFLLQAGLAVHNVFDTLLAAIVLDGGRHHRKEGYFTMAALARRTLGITLDKAEQQSDWAQTVLTAEQLRYAALDAAVLLPLVNAIRTAIDNAGVAEAVAIECRAVPAMAWLELAGVPFDREAWMALSDNSMLQQLRLTDEIAQLIRDELGLGRTINLDSPRQVQRLLADLGITVASTSEEDLVAVARQHPLVPLLLAYREASKRAGTYGIEYLKHVHPVTGRIHASYFQIGAVTGRMSCSRPNVQQVPKTPAFRGCFHPGTGRLLVRADLSLVELCVAAGLSGDQRLVQAIADGQDLHRLTAAALFACSQEQVTQEQRAFGKAVNFGTLYGQGLTGLIATAAEHGLSLTPTQARLFQRRFAAAWPRLADWKQAQMQGTTMVVRTASGRTRWLAQGSSNTVRVNTPVQGTAADCFKLALALLWETRARHPSAVPVLAVHDELVVECDAAKAEEVAGWVATCLRDGMARFIPDVPVRVDVIVGHSWAGDVPPERVNRESTRRS